MTRGRAPWWMYVVAASFAGCYLVGLYIRVRGPEPPFASYSFDRGSMLVERLWPDSAVRRAGLQVGDRVISFDGVPTQGTANWDAISINLEPGRPYPIEIERGGQQQRVIATLERRSLGRQPLVDRIRTVDSMIIGVVFLTLAAFVAFSRPHDVTARLGALILGLIGIALSAPTTGSGPVFRQLPIAIGVFFSLAFPSVFLFPTVLFSFCATFPRRLFRAWWAWVLTLAPSTLFVTMAIPGFFYLTFFNPRATGMPFKLDPETVPRIGAGILAAYVAAAMVALVVNYRRLGTSEQRRVRVLVAGTVASFAGLIPAQLLRVTGVPNTGVAAIFYSDAYALVASLLFLALPVSWAYAILRHRVFDIGVMVRQGLRYALARRVLTTVVPGLGIVLLTDLLLHGQQPLLDILRARGWAYGALGALAILANVKRHTWLAALDRRFFRERYDAQRLLKEVVEDARQARSFERVAPDVVRRVEAALHPQVAALLVREPHELAYRSLAMSPAGYALPPLPGDGKVVAMMRLLGKPIDVPQSGSGWLTEQLPPEETRSLRQASIELLVPIALGTDRTEAMLVLGSKRSEEPYAREDRDLLVAIAASLAMLLDQPAPAAARSDMFEECPQCGACYDNGATQCSNDAKRLVPVLLPRMLDGRYLLQQRLGRGGMGTVYAASDSALERRVAVKVVREDLVGSLDAADRFRREARAAAAFAHSNVVTVHDFGVVAGTRAFLVMELLHGEPARAALHRDRRFTTARTLAILRGVSAALDAAHRLPLVHRDLKPENIFLVDGQAGETVKLLDFGLAKFTAIVEQATGECQTAPGMVPGTPRYMSPEQRRGEEVHPRWDLWAAAVVAYEMLTGAHPFEGAAAGDAGRSPRLVAYADELSPRRQAFFDAALSPDADRRPQSAGQFLSELEAALA